jgi:hypothetical protein
MTTQQELDGNFRLGWMRFMYAFTLVAAGSTGLAILLAPEVLTDLLGWPFPEPLFPGAYAGCLVAFGILSALGLRSPIKFAPVLLFQLCYKVTWVALVIIPLWMRGELPSYHGVVTMFMIVAIIGDLIAVPFAYFFKKSA